MAEQFNENEAGQTTSGRGSGYNVNTDMNKYFCDIERYTQQFCGTLVADIEDTELMSLMLFLFLWTQCIFIKYNDDDQ